jgi:hypothetical protein
MTDRRPSGITLVCVLSVLSALLDLVLAQRDLGDFDTARWVDAHPRQAEFEQFYHYVDAGLTILACYFMMKAHTWARWLYLAWNAIRFGTAMALPFLVRLQEDLGFLRPNFSLIRSVAIFVLALWLLWRAEANEFFISARRPRWRE